MLKLVWQFARHHRLALDERNENGTRPRMSATEIAAIILAAGKGTRMKSATHKVLHRIGGRPMIGHLLASLDEVETARNVVVVGALKEQVEAEIPDAAIAVQEPQLGTGDAVLAAREAMAGFEGDVLTLYGDVPFVAPETLRAMIDARREGADLVVLGFRPADAAAYGRLVQSPDGSLARIVEFKDASEAERAIGLCNSGVMAADCAHLFALLDRVTNDNAKGEYYLTDIVELAVGDGGRVAVVEADEAEVIGINSRAELAEAEAVFQAKARADAMVGGATLIDPESVFFAFDTEVGTDVTIGPNVVFGSGVRISDGVTIHAFSHIEGAEIGPGAVVGPFARLRPGAKLGEDAKVGNFVEVKNAVISAGAKANHLSYIGDAWVGEKANIGAGTITCNYDGFNKYLTVIGDGAFVGSNSTLVPPVTVAAGGLTAAGSVITKDVSPDTIGLARARQENKEGAAARFRERKAAEKAAGKWPRPDPAALENDDG